MPRRSRSVRPGSSSAPSRRATWTRCRLPRRPGGRRVPGLGRGYPGRRGALPRGAGAARARGARGVGAGGDRGRARSAWLRRSRGSADGGRGVGGRPGPRGGPRGALSAPRRAFGDLGMHRVIAHADDRNRLPAPARRPRLPARGAPRRGGLVQGGVDDAAGLRAARARARPLTAPYARPMLLARARAIVDDVVASAPGPVSVFVADTHGELVAAATMDGAAPDTRLNAQRKAYTAARSDATSTRELADKARADPAERASFDPFFTFFLGGVAVFEDGRRVGAVGVSGQPGEVDERLALEAIERTARAGHLTARWRGEGFNARNLGGLPAACSGKDPCRPRSPCTSSSSSSCWPSPWASRGRSGRRSASRWSRAPPWRCGPTTSRRSPGRPRASPTPPGRRWSA